MRAKLLAAFLAGMVAIYGVRAMQDYTAVVNFRLDRIEQYLSQGGGAGSAPQSHRMTLRTPGDASAL